MPHEPDWESLGSIQYLLHQRVSEHLNAALSAVQLVDTDASAYKATDFWQQRAGQAIQRALDLENAWSSLISYKLGERFLPQSLVRFRAGELVRWLAVEVRMPHTASADEDMLLLGNRETLQEALLLLHSCAGTLGPHVRLIIGPGEHGLWFRIRYNIVKSVPPTLAVLAETLAAAGNWRADAALFELRRAEDFLSLSGCALHYSATDAYCELAFCVPAASAASAMTATQALTGDDDTAKDVGSLNSDLLSTPPTAPVIKPARRDADRGR